MNIKTIVISKNEIGLLKPLWEKLNEMHMKDSKNFKEFYKSFTFEKRCEIFSDYDESNVRIEVILEGNIPIGYCISTINKGIGEIDSIYIEENYRRSGYGKQFINNAIKWLKDNKTIKIQVAVAEGHESVFPYYEKSGFCLRKTYFELKD